MYAGWLRKIAKWPHLGTVAYFAGFLLLSLGAIAALLSYTQPTTLVREELEYSFTITSKFDGYVDLVPNPVFGERVRLSSLPVYLSAARNVTVTHSLSLTGGVFHGGVRYDVYLVHPDGWRLLYIANVSLPLSINITDAAVTIDGVAKIFGVSASDFSIQVVAMAAGQMVRGPYTVDVELQHPISISVSKGRNRLELVGNLTSSKNYNSTRKVAIPVYIAGRPVEEVRTLSVAVAMAGAALVIGTTALSVRQRKPEEAIDEKLAPLTVEVLEADVPVAAMLPVASPEVLAKLAKMLERPIIKQKWRGKVRYMVLDRGAAYYYEV